MRAIVSKVDRVMHDGSWLSAVTLQSICASGKYWNGLCQDFVKDVPCLNPIAAIIVLNNNPKNVAFHLNFLLTVIYLNGVCMRERSITSPFSPTSSHHPKTCICMLTICTVDFSMTDCVRVNVFLSVYVSVSASN